MKNRHEILTPESTYHVYNRANGSEKMFRSAENYRFFLQKYQEHIEPVADTFCYCLMPNHFHFLLRIKTEQEIKSVLRNLQGLKNLEGLREVKLENFISLQFSKFFNSYAKVFNKLHNRKGSLFMHTFKRKQINDNDYLLKLVHYIHHNPVESDLCDEPEQWDHSSYSTILSTQPAFLKREEVINWFNDLDNFIYMHKAISAESEIKI